MKVVFVYKHIITSHIKFVLPFDAYFKIKKHTQKRKCISLKTKSSYAKKQEKKKTQNLESQMIQFFIIG